MGLVAFTKTLTREGAKYNIKSTAIAPVCLSIFAPAVGIYDVNRPLPQP